MTNPLPIPLTENRPISRASLNPGDVHRPARRSLFLSEWVSRPWMAFSVALLSLLASLSACVLLDQWEALKRSVSREASEISWVVFLQNHADKNAIEESLRSFPGIKTIRFISKEEAYEQVVKDPKLSQSLILTGRNPFPESFEIRWERDFLKKDYLEHAARKAGDLEGVDRVGYERERVGRSDILQRLYHQLGFLFTILLWAGSLIFFILVGRVAFFPRGPFPGRILISALVLGTLGGSLGAWAGQQWVAVFTPAVLGVGPAVGLILALIQEP
jgi:hypothetical protein